MKNFNELNVQELTKNQKISIEGGTAPSWSDIYDFAYSGDWYSAIRSVEDKVGDFFE